MLAASIYVYVHIHLPTSSCMRHSFLTIHQNAEPVMGAHGTLVICRALECCCGLHLLVALHKIIKLMWCHAIDPCEDGYKRARTTCLTLSTKILQDDIDSILTSAGLSWVAVVLLIVACTISFLTCEQLQSFVTSEGPCMGALIERRCGKMRRNSEDSPQTTTFKIRIATNLIRAEKPNAHYYNTCCA